MKRMDFLNKSIEVLEKQIKHGVNFQNLVSGENLALTWYFNYKNFLIFWQKLLLNIISRLNLNLRIKNNWKLKFTKTDIVYHGLLVVVVAITTTAECYQK